jgi:hypothetical protein
MSQFLPTPNNLLINRYSSRDEPAEGRLGISFTLNFDQNTNLNTTPSPVPYIESVGVTPWTGYEVNLTNAGIVLLSAIRSVVLVFDFYGDSSDVANYSPGPLFVGCKQTGDWKQIKPQFSYTAGGPVVSSAYCVSASFPLLTNPSPIIDIVKFEDASGGAGTGQTSGVGQITFCNFDWPHFTIGTN